MTAPKLLDLYCCQGGASRGYHQAGYDVYGIDIDAQPRYPYPFFRGDAIAALTALLAGAKLPFTNPAGEITWLGLDDFDAIHASPPCQLYSVTHRINRSDFPDLIGPTRDLLVQTGLPYVIENVVGAANELQNPGLLCGAMFGLHTYRHRLFETSLALNLPEHPHHTAPTTKMGRRPREDEYMHIVGNFSGVERARQIMNMPWANRDGLREAIPPAYTCYLGGILREVIA